MAEVPLTPSPGSEEKPSEARFIQLTFNESDASALNALVCLGVIALTEAVLMPLPGGRLMAALNTQSTEQFVCACAEARHMPCPDHQPNKAAAIPHDRLRELIETEHYKIREFAGTLNRQLIEFVTDFRHRELESFSAIEE